MQNQTSPSLTSYELQTYQGGNWKIDSIYDDKDLALDMGKQLLSTRRATAVRVVEEDFVDGKLKSRVIFRKSVVDGENAQARERKMQTMREVQEARKETQSRVQDRARLAQRKADSQSFTWLFLKFFGIGVFGVLAFLVLTRIIAHG
ncbi:MAG TPA: hypothetical protein VKY65_05250 [Alphaproteobacteria bacterium]|nr:hypothetical protein [Alphaproteobacteria bacterium]